MRPDHPQALERSANSRPPPQGVGPQEHPVPQDEEARHHHAGFGRPRRKAQSK
jgi:hypothetical protein